MKPSNIRPLLIGAALLLTHLTFAQFTAIDSLEELSKKAKPGWDQIDYAVGLARLYIGGSGNLEKGREKIEIIYRNTEEEDIPEGRAYGLIMENLIGYIVTNDVDESIRKSQEAIEIAKRYNCNDAIIFAGYQLGERYWVSKGDFFKAIEIFEALLPYLDETVDFKHEANLKKNLGYMYTRTGQPEKGFALLEESLVLFERMKTDPYIDPRIGRVSAQYGDIDNLIQYSLNMISESKLRLGEPEVSRQFQQKALEKAESSQRQRLIAWQLTRIGLHFELRGYYERALGYYQRARVIFEDHELKNAIANSNVVLARIMTNLNDLDNARSYSAKALDFYESTSDTLNIALQLIYAADIELRSENMNRVVELKAEAERLFETIPSAENRGEFRSFQGDFAMANSNTLGAIENYEAALAYFDRVNHRLGKVKAFSRLTEAYLAHGDLEKALINGNQALEYAKDQSNVYYTREAYLLLSQTYEQMNDLPRSLDSYKSFVTYNDSVFTADTQVKLKEEQVRREVVGLETSRDEAEAQATALEETNRLYLIAGVIMVFVLAFIAYLYINLNRVKAKIQSQNEELKMLNKTRDKFFGIIAHDLRSPLMGLHSVTEQIEYFLAKGEVDKLKEVGRAASESTERVTDLLDNLLNWALLQNGMIPIDRERLALQPVAQSVCDLLEPTARLKDIEIENHIDEKSELNADKKAIETVLRNLISNAIKFTDTDGRIIVSSTGENGKTIISVKDDGIGIESDKLSHIFDLDTKSSDGTGGEKGAGLGLVLCKELVELNGGEITVESTKGQGTEFIISL